MRSFVSTATSGLSLRARETVAFDTPVTRAMSAIVWIREEATGTGCRIHRQALMSTADRAPLRAPHGGVTALGLPPGAPQRIGARPFALGEPVVDLSDQRAHRADPRHVLAEGRLAERMLNALALATQGARLEPQLQHLGAGGDPCAHRTDREAHPRPDPPARADRSARRRALRGDAGE